MKRCISFILLALLLVQACNKEKKSPLDPALARKYARYSAPVYREKEMKHWLTTLAKAEYVDLLAVTQLQVRNKKREIAKVRLSDDSEGFIDMNTLADKPIVFLSETRALVRNNPGSALFMVVPRGTIAFIIAEKGDWSQVYAGIVNGKSLSGQWVRGGFSTDQNLITEARALEEAAAGLESDESSDESRKQATARLTELAVSSRAFGDLAKKKLVEFADKSGDRTIPEEGSMGGLPDRTVEEQ